MGFIPAAAARYAHCRFMLSRGCGEKAFVIYAQEKNQIQLKEVRLKVGWAMNKQLDKTVNRTPHPDCPACKLKRLHNAEEWKQFHPLAGTGIMHDVEIGKK